MNERIRELREQAMEWVPNQVDPDTKIRLLNAEKFAELIVQECAEWIVDNADSMEHLGPTFFAKAMKTEFGVEE
jgi:hypothetical protein